MKEFDKSFRKIGGGTRSLLLLFLSAVGNNSDLWIGQLFLYIQ